MNVKKAIATLMGSLVSVTPALAQGPVESTLNFLQSLGVAQVLIWLITFAVVFGMLKKTSLPKPAAGIIGIAAGLLVLMTLPAAITTFVSTMSAGLLIVVLGVLGFIVFLEIVGVNHKEIMTKKNKDTGQTGLSGIGALAALVVLGLAALVFANAGGLSFLAIGAIPSFSLTTIAFVVVLLAAIYWVSQKE